MRIACNSVAREGKGREAALASGVHALHLPVPVPRAAAPLPANTPAGSNPRAASYVYIYIRRRVMTMQQSILVCRLCS